MHGTSETANNYFFVLYVACVIHRNTLPGTADATLEQYSVTFLFHGYHVCFVEHTKACITREKHLELVSSKKLCCST